MFKTEKDVTNWIYSFTTHKTDRNLDHLHEYLATLDNPHLKLKTVHIAGTNGKGSTVAYIRQAFMEAGYKVATFTSPFITCFGERMSINNIPMPEDKLIHYAAKLKNSLPSETPAYTSFDIVTLISFMYFLDEAVDIAIYETGIGGRLDSTNVIQPLATAITNVGHDHADVLGETQLERAIEKLGIVKKDIPLFTAEEDPILILEFSKVCHQKGAEIFHALKDARMITMDRTGITFDWGHYQNIQIEMYGEHQFKNASLAVVVLEYLRISTFESLDPTAIIKARWQGRFEHVRRGNRPVILDGAHNIEGISALIKTVNHLYPDYQSRHYIFSAIDTKDVKEMLEMLEKDSYLITLTANTHPKSIDPEMLSECLVDEFFNTDYKEAIKDELDKMSSNEVLVICGSLYFVSDARRYLLEEDGRFLI